MADFFYLRNGDDLVQGNATLEVDSGTEDTEYPAANLGNQNVNKPAKLTTTTGRWKIDLGSAMDIQFAALLVSNLDGGLTNFDLEGHATDDWGAPSFSTSFVLPGNDVAGFPFNAFLDLGGSQSFRWWSIVANDANSANLILGEWVLSTIVRQFSRNFLNGRIDEERRAVKEQETEAGVVGVFQQPTRGRSMVAQFYSKTVDATALQDLQKANAGRALQFIAGLDLAVNDCFYGRLTGGAASGHVERVLRAGTQGHVAFEFAMTETAVKIPG